jgi:hypothetical protein
MQMNARTFGFLALAAFAPAAIAQDLEQKISFSGPAMPAKQLLQEISKKANYTFDTSPQTAQEVLLVRVKDVQLGELLKKVAEASGAEWVKEEGLYRLVRGATLKQNQERADLAARGEQISKSLEAVYKKLDQKPNFTQADVDALTKEQRDGRPAAGGGVMIGGYSDGSPSGRALLRLLRLIPTSELASIAPGTRVVYSSNATRMQIPLRGNSRGVLNQYVNEQNMYASLFTPPPPEQPTAGGNVRVFTVREPDPVQINGRIGKALLVVTRFGTEAAFSIDLKVFDESGKLLSRSNRFVTTSPSPLAAGSPSSADQALQLSADSKALAKILVNPQTIAGGPVMTGGTMFFRVATSPTNSDTVMIGGPGSEATQLTPEWRERLSNPDKYEPLAYIAGELYGAAGDAKGMNVVADLPDTVLMPLARRISNGILGANQLVTVSTSELDLNVVQKDGWMIVGPKYPSEAYASRIDRVALGNLLRRAVANGYSRLDDLAAYAQKQPSRTGQFSFDERLMTLISPDTGAMGIGIGTLDRRLLLRLYATLGMTQKRTLGNEGRLDFSGMASNQLALVSSLVYDTIQGPNVLVPPPSQGAREDQFQEIVRAGPGGTSVQSTRNNEVLIMERTEALPNGVPRDGFLILNVENKEAVLATRSNAGGSRIFAASDLGSHQAVQSSQNMPMLASNPQQPDFDLYRPGTLTNYSFNFNLSPMARMSRSLQDMQINTGTRSVPYAQLSAKFREEVDAAKRRVAEVLKNIQMVPPGGGIRQGTPPPAP